MHPDSAPHFAGFALLLQEGTSLDVEGFLSIGIDGPLASRLGWKPSERIARLAGSPLHHATRFDAGMLCGEIASGIMFFEPSLRFAPWNFFAESCRYRPLRLVGHIFIDAWSLFFVRLRHRSASSSMRFRIGKLDAATLSGFPLGRRWIRCLVFVATIFAIFLAYLRVENSPAAPGILRALASNSVWPRGGHSCRHCWPCRPVATDWQVPMFALC